MRLLLVSHYFSTHGGGVEAVAGRLAEAMAGEGRLVTWIAADASREPDLPPGVRAHALATFNGIERRTGVPVPVPLPAAWRIILREVAAADAVMVHDTLYLANIIACLAALARRRPLLIVQHVGATPYRSRPLRWLVKTAEALVSRPLLARAGQAAFISQRVADRFAGLRFRRPPAVVFNGMDAGRFRPAADAPEKTRLRQRLGLPLDKPVALFAGRFVERKGLPILRLAAASRFDLHWALAGRGPVDPAAWGLPNLSVFEHMAPEALAELYRAADVLVLPSVGEGFPLVVQEALASGLPVVCDAEAAGADPAAAPWLEALAVEGRAPEAVATDLGAALDRVLARPRDPEAASRFARERYDWAEAARRYLALIAAI